MISVCIATYNGERFIKQQIDSILKQIGPNDEIVISDDHSTDNTIDIIKNYKDPRIKIFYNDTNKKSVILNFENALKHSEGDYIFLCDQDDIWDETKISTFLLYFRSNKDIYLYLSDLYIINENGEINKKEFFHEAMKLNLLSQILKNNFIGCSMAFKKELKKYILPFPNNIEIHDWWIGLCAILFFKVGFIDKKLLFYRRHNANVTSGERRSLMKIIKSRIFIIINLVKRVYIKRCRE